MNSKDYEDFVERVVSEIDFWRGAKVFRNKKYPGVRQTGQYEIDIAFELNLTDLVFFRLIVECKNHTRPVTRPVVQQLAQTRDAICAHKAAIASPVGFSEEAIEVAKDLGIALWVIAIDKPISTIMAYEGLQILRLSEDYFALRTNYLKLFGIESTVEKFDESQMVSCLSDTVITKDKDSQHTYKYMRPISTGSAYFTYKNHQLFDNNCALNQVIKWVFEELGNDLISLHQSAIKDWEKDVLKSFKDKKSGNKVVEYVRDGKQNEFFSHFMRN